MTWPGPHLLRQANGAGDIDAGRTAHAQAFMLEEVEGDRDSFGIGNLKRLVDDRALEILW